MLASAMKQLDTTIIRTRLLMAKANYTHNLEADGIKHTVKEGDDFIQVISFYGESSV